MGRALFLTIRSLFRVGGDGIDDILAFFHRQLAAEAAADVPVQPGDGLTGEVVHDVERDAAPLILHDRGIVLFVDPAACGGGVLIPVQAQDQVALSLNIGIVQRGAGPAAVVALIGGGLDRNVALGKPGGGILRIDPYSGHCLLDGVELRGEHSYQGVRKGYHPTG